MAKDTAYADAPNLIKSIGKQIILTFAKTSPTTGRISWNIPTINTDCSGGVESGYNGVVVTLDTSTTDISKMPVDGTIYIGDPTGDTNIHLGSKLDSSLVVGAYYNDKTTAYVDVIGLSPNGAYYASGFAVDAQNRYHTTGTHAYSLPLTNGNETPDTSSSQVIQLPDGTLGAVATGLTLTTPYTFNISIDGTEYPISINGTDAQTYDDFIDELNKQIQLITNPFQSPTPPNSGSFYWDGTTVFLFDGTNNIQQNAIIEGIDPTTLPVGRYWYDSSTNLLQRWDTPNVGWNTVIPIEYKSDPNDISCNTLWFNGTTQAYEHDGTVWCELPTFNQSLDPSLAPILPCGTYWYDTTNLTVKKWDAGTLVWEDVDVIYWDTNLQNLSNGTYWYNQQLEELKRRNGVAWVDEFVATGDEPIAPMANMFWYDGSDLQQRNALNTAWVIVPALEWATDPSIVGSCSLWWDSVADVLNVWDVLLAQWTQVVQFLQVAIDPASPPILEIGTYWYDTNTNQGKLWNGVSWDNTDQIIHTTDPSVMVLDLVWRDTANGVWQSWDGASWVVFDPIDSIVDPQVATLPLSQLWYDASTDALNSWNGVGWVNIAFSTQPLTPTLNQLWFDTSVDILKTWNGSEWIVATPIAAVVMDGNIVITTTSVGSGSSIEVVDGDLFSSLLPVVGVILAAECGNDGISGQTMSEQIGVGTDLSEDERKDFTNRILRHLGHPLIKVELTKDQLDDAINNALRTLRQRSSAANKRAFFFMTVKPGVQGYIMSDKTAGTNRIVDIMELARGNGMSVFSALGGGIGDPFGMAMLNNMFYSGNTFDLLDYHLLSSYIEDVQTIFATRLRFQFSEHTRRLDIIQRFHREERILMDCYVERTEQELMNDRYTGLWIEQYATALARQTLAEVRGKYSALPGPQGTMLNADVLVAKADAKIQELLLQLEEYVVDDPSEYGMGSTFLIG